MTATDRIREHLAESKSLQWAVHRADLVALCDLADAARSINEETVDIASASYIRDNDRSRAAVQRIRAALARLDGEGQ